jgi:hypothetical protein
LVQESIEKEYLVKAAMTIPNEYGTLMASYMVRRPYIHDVIDNHDPSSRDDIMMWSLYAHLTSKEEYQQCATALDPTSIDIVAYIEADGSVFTLTGRCDARYGRLSSSANNVASAHGGGGSLEEARSYEEDEYEWVVFDDVEGTDRALGKVTYIDVEGNERDYWLGTLAHFLPTCSFSEDDILNFKYILPSRLNLRRGIDNERIILHVHAFYGICVEGGDWGRRITHDVECSGATGGPTTPSGNNPAC